MQVVNKPGGNGAVAAAALYEKQGRPATPSASSPACWIAGPLTTQRGEDHGARSQAHRAARARARGDRGARRFAVQDAQGLHRRGEGEARASSSSRAARSPRATTSCASSCSTRPGAKWAYVSFPGGGERLAALLGGHVDIMVIEPQEAGEQVRAGKLRVLAQLTEKRLPGYPDVPTLKEAGFDVHAHPADPRRGGAAAACRPKRRVLDERFEKLRQTASWKKYIADNQLEEAFVAGARSSRKAMVDIEKRAARAIPARRASRRSARATDGCQRTGAARPGPRLRHHQHGALVGAAAPSGRSRRVPVPLARALLVPLGAHVLGRGRRGPADREDTRRARGRSRSSSRSPATAASSSR